MTLFFYFLFNKLFARSSFSQNQLNLLVEKMGKKQSLSAEEQAQIVTLRNLKFSVRQIAEKMKVSKTAVYNAIMKYQNEGVFINRKRSGRSRVTTTREDCFMYKAVSYSLSNEYLQEDPC